MKKKIIIILAIALCFVSACRPVERGKKDDDIDSSAKLTFVVEDKNSSFNGNSYIIDASKYLCVNGVQKTQLTDEDLAVVFNLTGFLGQGNSFVHVNTKGLSEKQLYAYSRLPEIFDTLARGNEPYCESRSDPDWDLHKNKDYDKDDKVTYKEYAMSMIKDVNKKIGNE